MIKMGTINERISYLIDLQTNGNRKKFSEKIGFAAQVVSNIVSGRKSKPSFDVINSIISTFDDLNANWLITGEGEMLKETATKKESNKPSTYQAPKVVTVDKQSNDNIVLVPVKASAGYLSGYRDPEFIKQLPTYNLPKINNGTFRMFEISGHSMFPTLHNGAFVVGEWIEKWDTEIKDGYIYVIVSQNDGVVVKRVLNRIEKYGSLYCKSDNRREYPSFNINANEILEVWQVKLNISFELPDPSDIHDRLNDLEAEIFHLKTLNKG